MTTSNKDQQTGALLPSGTDLPIPWHLSLPRPLEDDFVVYLLQGSRRVILASMAAVLLIYAGGSWVEYMVNPDALIQTWRLRLLSLMTVVLVWLVSRNPRHLRLLQPAVVVAVLVMAVSSNYAAHLVDHTLSYTYYLVNIFAVLLMGTLFRITLRWAALTSAIILVILGVCLYALSEQTPEQATLTLYFIAGCATLSLFGQYYFERLQRQHFLAERVLAMHRSELHSANIVLESQVTEDPLTGTINRRGMEVRLNHLIHQARHDPGQGSIHVLLFDIDFFKQYNDTYGHPQGDETLRMVAGVPKSMVQNDTDFVARYGGEEFLVVLGGSQLNDALVFAERMRSRIEKLGIEHSASRVSAVVTISVGIAGLTREVTHANELIQRADEALYEAKGLGRNRSVVVEPDGRFRVL